MFTVAIVTVSDKGAKGQRQDTSAQVIKQLMADQGWQVQAYKIVPDHLETIQNTLTQLVQQDRVDLILTTGGTGFSPRDVTPEATLAVITRQAPGLAEAMRQYSLQKTNRAMLSRAQAGIAQQTLIINLPGSPKGVQECLEAILPALPHGLEILTGQTTDCAQP